MHSFFFSNHLRPHSLPLSHSFHLLLPMSPCSCFCYCCFGTNVFAMIEIDKVVSNVIPHRKVSVNRICLSKFISKYNFSKCSDRNRNTKKKKKKFYVCLMSDHLVIKRGCICSPPSFQRRCTHTICRMIYRKYHSGDGRPTLLLLRRKRT